jgi:hypothetical protein
MIARRPTTSLGSGFFGDEGRRKPAKIQHLLQPSDAINALNFLLLKAPI